MRYYSLANNRKAALINELHKLWLRAPNAQTLEQQIEILKVRPGDLEALNYKADAALEINQYH